MKAAHPHGAITYARDVVRGYIDGKEKPYMVLDAVAELRVCAKRHPAIDIISHALNMEDETLRLKLMRRALKVLEP